ncbi:MAG: thiolase, partial [Chloroflexi bacterium]|nr:thiolase [Chloroflexota bacterium]
MPGPLADKTAIVGVGETPHMKFSGRTTFSMATEAIKKAILDAGMTMSDIDGMTSYMAGADSTSSDAIATALGIQLNYGLDIIGGGSSSEALVAHAVGLIAGGYCKTMVVFRSMNGRSFNRMGGQTPTGPKTTPAGGQNAWQIHSGMTTPAQMFGNAA